MMDTLAPLLDACQSLCVAEPRPWLAEAQAELDRRSGEIAYWSQIGPHSRIRGRLLEALRGGYISQVVREYDLPRWQYRYDRRPLYCRGLSVRLERAYYALQDMLVTILVGFYFYGTLQCGTLEEPCKPTSTVPAATAA
jgi:hypothetical protein